MADMVVARDDKRSFLEKVISFGMEHGILTHERRQQLARESVDFSQSLFQIYGLNAVDIQDALKVARITHQLTSIALERVSQGGNVSVAARLLATTKVKTLAGLVLMIIRSTYRRILKTLQRGHAHRYTRVDQLDFISMLDVFSSQHSPYSQDEARASPREFQYIEFESERLEKLQSFRNYLRNRQCEVALSLHTSHDLDQWLDEIETTARELTSRSTRKRR